MDRQPPFAEAITVPDAPAIPGLILRRFRGEADYPLLVDLYNRTVAADQVDMVTTVDELAHWFTPSEHFDPACDLLLAEVDGAVIAYGNVAYYAEVDAQVYTLAGRVAPEWRRLGLGRAILHHNERHLRTLATTHPSDRPRTFQAFVFANAPGVTALLQSEGYLPVRHFYDMVRHTLDDLPDAPLPPGLEVRPVQPAHYRAIWEADQEIFHDHWGFIPGTEEDYQRWLAFPHFDPSLWCVAWAGAEVAGQVRSFIMPAENRTFNRQRGYTEDIGVCKPWRQRGLARALIGLSFQALRLRGMTEAALRVDTDNASGALRLYERCGFQVVKHHSAYRKPMT